MPGDPLQPVLGGTVPFDATAYEIESRAELDVHLAKRSLAGLIVLGLRLDVSPPDLTGIDVRGTLFVGCRLASAEVEVDLIRRGALLVPSFEARPYPTYPATLYTPEDLAAGFDQSGFAGMYDTVVYRHFVAHGGATPDIREALAQRLHDAGIDNALDPFDAFAHPMREILRVKAQAGHSLLAENAVKLTDLSKKTLHFT